MSSERKYGPQAVQQGILFFLEYFDTTLLFKKSIGITKQTLLKLQEFLQRILPDYPDQYTVLFDPI